MSDKPAVLRIDKPGVYEMPAEVYHADPCVMPSLSSSLAKDLVNFSPAHAWTKHPRLNPKFVAEESSKFDLGAAVHAILLEGVDRMAIVHAEDFKTTAARIARDEARARGKHPVLASQYEKIMLMHEVALRKIAECTDLGFRSLSEGAAERTMIWEEDGVWMRVRPDWVIGDRSIIVDYKSTKAAANPIDWIRTMVGMTGEVQTSLYLRGNAATGGPKDAKWIFLVQENFPPFACSLIGMPPEFVELGDEKVEYAIALWRQCMRHNKWPAYYDRVVWIEPPAWHVTKWEERAVWAKAQAEDAEERATVPAEKEKIDFEHENDPLY